MDWRLLAACGLVVANAGFVAAEFALVAVDRTRVNERAAAGDRNAQRVKRLLGRLSYHLSGAQLGITVTSLMLGYLAEPAIAVALEPAVGAVFGEGTPRGVSVGIALAAATVVQMVMGELVPKTVATTKPFRSSAALARPVAVYGILAKPAVAFLDGIADRLVRMMGIEPRHDIESTPDRDEIAHHIATSGREGVLDPGEVRMLTRSIRLRGKHADDAMVPRVDVETIPAGAPLADLAELAAATGHSRFPVTGAGIDDIVGVVHAKSLFNRPAGDWASVAVSECMDPAPAVPESRGLIDLMDDMRAGSGHLAVVVDDHGGTSGIITLEDVLEEVVGEIDDEHDIGAPDLTRPGPGGSAVLPAGMHPDEVRDAAGFDMPPGEYETLAGLVLNRLGRIPSPGDAVEVDGWRLEVAAMDRLRIAAVAVEKLR